MVIDSTPLKLTGKNMITKPNLLIATVLLFVVTGCSSNPTLNRQALSGNKVSTVQIQAAKQLQSEVSDKGVTASHSSAGGLFGAVIGMGIDSVVNANRRRVMTSVVSALGNHNIETQLADKLRTMKGTSFTQPITVKTVTNNASLKDNELGISANTYLAANHQHVVTVSNIQIKPTGSQTTYNAAFKGQADVDFGGQKGINATQYLIDNPDKLKLAIDQSIEKTVDQIASSLNN